MLTHITGELLLTERTFDKGWLYEVEDDLDWMRACADFPDLPPTPDSSSAWADFLQWLRDASPSWKTWFALGSPQNAPST